MKIVFHERKFLNVSTVPLTRTKILYHDLLFVQKNIAFLPIFTLSIILQQSSSLNIFYRQWHQIYFSIKKTLKLIRQVMYRIYHNWIKFSSTNINFKFSYILANNHLTALISEVMSLIKVLANYFFSVTIRSTSFGY